MMDRISLFKGRPPQFNISAKKPEILAHYKCYQQYYISRMGFKYAIIWMPYEENQHMPEDLRPRSKDGFVALVNARGISTDGKDVNGISLAVAGTPIP